MNEKLDKIYDHHTIEEELYKWWESEDFFRPEKMKELGLINKKSPRYCITIPLPNVTGILHLGHAITISLEDLMTRYERMNQKETLYIPGTDHAGIATQNVVERELLKEGIKRKELGREKFVEKVWEWKDQYHARITKQSKRLGISSDWSRERFTLDKQLSQAVREAFYRLYQKGLIYRGEYMVNWCPGRCESAISDLEAIPEEEQGHLWYIKYPITGKNWKKPKNEWGSGKWAEGATNFITVATTRPETLLGDSAIATTSTHKEYGKFVGKKAVLPAVGRKIPIITDPHVDPEFGTGAVKITPSHDPNDFEVGQKHKLEFINIFDEKARILPEIMERYANMDRYECRKAILEDIKKEGLLVNIESHMHAIAHCQRCNTIIEPRVSIQWFVKTTELASAAVKSVKNKETIILPKREEHRFYLWMDNIHDWCISRQLWWGHRIPVWYCNDCNAEICPEPNIDHVDTCPECESKNIEQEKDVLDTWFSSALWPFSTLGWPNLKNPDYKRFYPNDMRETGNDILFFWVAKEMMLGIELTGSAPYKTVYLHGMIRDANGQKISKSMENVEDYDPLKIIENVGADSLRYALISNSVPGLDTNVDPRNLDAAHRFCNKIWQATRFVLSNIKEDDEIKSFRNELKTQLSFSDKWILSRINRVSKGITECMAEFNYLKAAREIKNFFWNEFCDWYIEISKIRLYDEENSQKSIQKTVLLHVLETSLRLLHPIMPFITEKLWQSLPKEFTMGPSIMFSQWPQTDEEFIDEGLEEKFAIIFDFIREIRSIKHDFGIPLNAKIALQIETSKSDIFEIGKRELLNLANIDPEKITIAKKINPDKQSAKMVLHGISAYIPLKGTIDLEQEKIRLNNQLEKIDKQISKINKKLNSEFSKRAPKELIEKENEKLTGLELKKQQLNDQISILD